MVQVIGSLQWVVLAVSACYMAVEHESRALARCMVVTDCNATGCCLEAPYHTLVHSLLSGCVLGCVHVR